MANSQAFRFTGSNVGPGRGWHLNPNFRVTEVPRSSDSVLPWARGPSRARPCVPHSPGPRSALQSPRRAPSGTSPPPAAAVHAPAPPPPRCPLQHRAGSARSARPADPELGGLLPGALSVIAALLPLSGQPGCGALEGVVPPCGPAGRGLF